MSEYKKLSVDQLEQALAACRTVAPTHPDYAATVAEMANIRAAIRDWDRKHLATSQNRVKSRIIANADKPVAQPAASKPNASRDPAPTHHEWQVTGAASTARREERQRWERVFASEHSRGRERGCATLLSCDANYSADAILKQLAHLPTDGEQAAKSSAAKSDAIWDRARQSTDAARGSQAGQILSAQHGERPRSAHAARILAAQDKAKRLEARPRETGSSDPWDRAYGNIAKERSQ